MPVTETILEQLGGQKFRVMTGASNFVGDEANKCLTFKVPNARFHGQAINLVKITLTGDDLYRVEFLYFRGLNVRAVATAEDVYADKLRSVFTAHTGLDTSL